MANARVGQAKRAGNAQDSSLRVCYFNFNNERRVRSLGRSHSALSLRARKFSSWSALVVAPLDELSAALPAGILEVNLHQCPVGASFCLVTLAAAAPAEVAAWQATCYRAGGTSVAQL